MKTAETGLPTGPSSPRPRLEKEYDNRGTAARVNQDYIVVGCPIQVGEHAEAAWKFFNQSRVTLRPASGDWVYRLNADHFDVTVERILLDPPQRFKDR